MYHSKVVILCWAAVFAIAVLAGLLKKSWAGLGDILIGALIVAAGVGASHLLNNIVGAFLLSVALMAAAYFTLKGIVAIFTRTKSRPDTNPRR